MKKFLAIMMFGAISLTSAQASATVTEGDISGGAGFVKGCDTGSSAMWCAKATSPECTWTIAGH
jgi:hypothetical protein